MSNFSSRVFLGFLAFMVRFSFKGRNGSVHLWTAMCAEHAHTPVEHESPAVSGMLFKTRNEAHHGIETIPNHRGSSCGSADLLLTHACGPERQQRGETVRRSDACAKRSKRSGRNHESP